MPNMPTEKASRPASISVSNDPLPEKLVAVTTPTRFEISAVRKPVIFTPRDEVYQL